MHAFALLTAIGGVALAAGLARGDRSLSASGTRGPVEAQASGGAATRLAPPRVEPMRRAALLERHW